MMDAYSKRLCHQICGHSKEPSLSAFIKQQQERASMARQISRDKEQAMSEKINTTATQLQEANNAINQKTSALDRAIRAGRVRLPAASCVQAPTSATTAPTDSKETGSQSDRPADPAPDAERETLQAIAEIVAQGDRNTAALNACIESYENVRNLLNDNKL